MSDQQTAGRGRPPKHGEAMTPASGQARGRPVGVTLDGHGGLLVADDVCNCVWRVRAAAP